MTEIGFDLPALAIELRQVGFRITFRIEQCGGQRDDARAASTFGNSAMLKRNSRTVIVSGRAAYASSESQVGRFLGLAYSTS